MSDNKKKKVYRNPSPEEIEKLTEEKLVKAIPASKVTSEKETSPSVKNNKKVKIQETEDNKSVKEDESIFSPPKHEYKLIMGNKYPQDNITDGKVLVRRMTAVEEGFFHDIITELNIKIFFETISRTIENCIRSNINIYDLCMVEKLALFIYILVLTYGAKHDFDIECPVCGLESTIPIDLKKDIKINYFGKNVFPIPIQLTSYDFPVTLYLRYPTISEEVLYMDDDSEWILKIRQIVHKIEGKLPNDQPITEENYDDIMNNLGPDDTEKIKEALINLSNYGANLMDISVKLCENKKCKLWNKVQTVVIPIDQIFMKVFK